MYIYTCIYLYISSIQVSDTYELRDFRSQFKEIVQFSIHTTKLFVQEIRKRASNQSTGLLYTSFYFLP